MLIRIIAGLLIATALSGCSKDSSPLLASLNPATSAHAAEPTNQDLSRKTLASKMLTAIALERVTGLKPDPARLAELD